MFTVSSTKSGEGEILISEIDTCNIIQYQFVLLCLINSDGLLECSFTQFSYDYGKHGGYLYDAQEILKTSTRLIFYSINI